MGRLSETTSDAKPASDLSWDGGIALLRWFDRHARDLPWRRTRDPYAIWVSEVMLQQTQVATVIPYYEQFLDAFPTVSHLARARESDVLRVWEGLGYYRRARALHHAATILQSEHDGVMPRDPAVLGQLPGLGRYTVNAVLSQAFDARLPILEANSRRVLCRLLGIDKDPSRADVQKTLWAAAENLLPDRRAGRFNQALMEIGALVCKAREPLCDRCPLKKMCAAHRLGRQHSIPKRPAKPRIEEIAEVALVIYKRGQMLLVQRLAEGRWGGMWEFPHGHLAEGETHFQGAQRLLDDLGIKGQVRAELLTIRHAVTRFRITMLCLGIHHEAGKARNKAFAQTRWVSPLELAELPLSSPQRKLAAYVSAESTDR